MLSNILDRISLIALSLVIVLLPVFFLPFSGIPVETSKGLLLVVGLVVCVIAWSAARFSDGKITLPKSWLLLSGLLIALVFLISAILSSASNISLFGVMLDTGTFWYIFGGFLLMLLSSMIVKNNKRASMILLGIFISFAVVFIFQLARFFHPNTLSLGVLGGKTDNLIGSWNTFAVLAGFFSLISLFIIEFFNVPKTWKWVLGIMTLISLVLCASVNFTFTWELIGIFALLIFVYKISITSSIKGEGAETKSKGAHFPVFSFVMIMVCLLFFMSGQFIGGLLPNKLGLSNIEVRPSASATFSVAKSALMKDPFFGVGPNRFSELWALYKPAVINSTQFWDSSFSSGSGLLPTLMVNTGFLGIISWLIFFVLFIMSGVKTLFTGIKKGANSEATLFFLGALYLFIASWFYSGSFIVLLMAFAFTGVFVGLSSAKEGKEFSMSFLNDPRRSFFFILFLIALMIVSAGVSFKYIERFVSVHYFGQVFKATTIEVAESSINKAIILHPNDLYLRTANQVYLTKINNLVNKGSALTDIEKGDIQTAFKLAESSAIMATQYDKSNALNFQTLGATYNVAGSLGVTDGYQKAIDAYTTASTLNPLNPGLKLIIARTYLTEGKIAEAKPFALEALKLKGDYVDALVVLSQIEKSLGNNTDALSYAESALSILPNNQNLIDYVNALRSGRNANPPAVTSPSDTTSSNSKTQ